MIASHTHASTRAHGPKNVLRIKGTKPLDMAPRKRGGSGSCSRSATPNRGRDRTPPTPRRSHGVRRRFSAAGFSPAWIEAHVVDALNLDAGFGHLQVSDTVKEAWRVIRGRRPEVQAALRSAVDVAGVLRAAGMDVNGDRVSRIVEALIPLWDDFSRDELVDDAIDQALGRKYATRFGPSLRFPPNGVECVEGAWFESLGPAPTRRRSIAHLNVAAGATSATVARLMRELRLKRDEGLGFHATSWESAFRIWERGVNREQGRPCLDFGLLRSFYVTPELLVAMEWAMTRRDAFASQTAILVFAIQRPLPLLHHEFPRADQAWMELTLSSRRCEVDSNELDEFDFVSGPMVANPAAVIDHGARPRAHVPPRFQLACKSNAAAGVLTPSLLAIVWLEHPQTASGRSSQVAGLSIR